MCAAIIWGRENSYDRWELFSTVPLMKFVTSLLAFMCSYDGFESLLFKQVVHWAFTKDDRDLSFIVVFKIDVGLFIALRISPKQVR